jgi:NAD(P)-dependent dehydrogenase (short-subunit alcohol dehydrogenase family)
MERLQGKFILITGASQGLGRQLAIDFAREGAAAISIVARRGDALVLTCSSTTLQAWARHLCRICSIIHSKTFAR